MRRNGAHRHVHRTSTTARGATRNYTGAAPRRVLVDRECRRQRLRVRADRSRRCSAALDPTNTANAGFLRAACEPRGRDPHRRGRLHVERPDDADLTTPDVARTAAIVSLHSLRRDLRRRRHDDRRDEHARARSRAVTQNASSPYVADRAADRRLRQRSQGRSSAGDGRRDRRRSRCRCRSSCAHPAGSGDADPGARALVSVRRHRWHLPRSPIRRFGLAAVRIAVRQPRRVDVGVQRRSLVAADQNIGTAREAADGRSVHPDRARSSRDADLRRDRRHDAACRPATRRTGDCWRIVAGSVPLRAKPRSLAHRDRCGATPRRPTCATHT